MTSAKLRFQVPDLLAAACDSLRPLLAFCRDLLEGSPVAIELGLAAAQGLPTLHDHVHVLGIQLHPTADALGEFCRGQRSSAAQHAAFTSGVNCSPRPCSRVHSRALATVS